MGPKAPVIFILCVFDYHRRSQCTGNKSKVIIDLDLSRPRQNRRNSAENIVIYILVNGNNFCFDSISIEIYSWGSNWK